MHSFIVFKYVNLILKKKNRENWLIFWGIWGDSALILRIWGSKEKYFSGAEEFSFRDLGDQITPGGITSNKEVKTPLPDATSIVPKCIVIETSKQM